MKDDFLDLIIYFCGNLRIKKGSYIDDENIEYNGKLMAI